MTYNLAAVERQKIEEALKHYGTQEAAATVLGISTKTLYNKLQQYKLDDASAEAASARIDQERDAELRRARGFYPNQYGAADTPYAWAEQDRFQASPGDGMESAEDSTSQLPLSMPERKEIQDVLPAHSTASGHGQKRRRV